MIEVIGGQGCKLSNKEAQALVDLLRRNFLYQQVLAVRDAESPKLLVEIFLTDWHAMLYLLHKAGGWDLTPEQKAEVAKKISNSPVASIDIKPKRDTYLGKKS